MVKLLYTERRVSLVCPTQGQSGPRCTMSFTSLLCTFKPFVCGFLHTDLVANTIATGCFKKTQLKQQCWAQIAHYILSVRIVTVSY